MAEWYVRKKQKEYGPYSSETLVSLVKQGRVTPSTFVRMGEDGPWTRASSVASLFATESSPSRSDTGILKHVVREHSFALIVAGAFVAVAIVVTTGFVIVLTRQAPSRSTPLEIASPAASEESRGMPDHLGSQQIVANSEGAVALISGKRSSGSGFVVRGGVVATNKHVINHELLADIEIAFPTDKLGRRGPFPVRLLYVDPQLDLAFLQVGSSPQPLPLSRALSRVRGEEVVVIGSPGLGADVVLENAVSTGVISTQTTIADNTYFQVSASVNPGNSGGPVLDGKGEVVGMVTLKGTLTEGMTFCIPADAISARLSTLDVLTVADIDRVESLHRARVVYENVGDVAAAYLLVIQLYGNAIDDAINQGLTPEIGIRAIQLQASELIGRVNVGVLDEMTRPFELVQRDELVPERLREGLIRYWENCIRLQEVVNNPFLSIDNFHAVHEQLRMTDERYREWLLYRLDRGGL